MYQYSYKAKKKNGQVFEGIVEAASEDEAAEVLSDRGLAVIFFNKLKGANRQAGRSFNLPFLSKIKKKEIVIFSRQLSVMISANVSVVQALRILIEQSDNETLKKVISEIADEVESGVKLSNALGKHDKIFSQFFVSMVKSGETSGKLDEVLEYLANQEEKDYDLVSKIKGAMI